MGLRIRGVKYVKKQENNNFMYDSDFIDHWIMGLL